MDATTQDFASVIKKMIGEEIASQTSTLIAVEKDRHDLIAGQIRGLQKARLIIEEKLKQFVMADYGDEEELLHV